VKGALVPAGLERGIGVRLQHRAGRSHQLAHESQQGLEACLNRRALWIVDQMLNHTSFDAQRIRDLGMRHADKPAPRHTRSVSQDQFALAARQR